MQKRSAAIFISTMITCIIFAGCATQQITTSQDPVLGVTITSLAGQNAKDSFWGSSGRLGVKRIYKPPNTVTYFLVVSYGVDYDSYDTPLYIKREGSLILNITGVKYAFDAMDTRFDTSSIGIREEAYYPVDPYWLRSLAYAKSVHARVIGIGRSYDIPLGEKNIQQFRQFYEEVVKPDLEGNMHIVEPPTKPRRFY